jgi:hypothetical protein
MRLMLACLLLTSCGSSSSQKDYSIKLFAVNVPCDYAAEVQAGITAKMQASGIPFSSELAGCIEQDWPYINVDDTKKALNQLTRDYGTGHYLTPRFGTYFNGKQSGNTSLSTAVEGRLDDSIDLAAHEILHRWGATHILDGCNVMGYHSTCDNAPILEKTLKEIGL